MERDDAGLEQQIEAAQQAQSSRKESSEGERRVSSAPSLGETRRASSLADISGGQGLFYEEYYDD